jgi:hypothetical protein
MWGSVFKRGCRVRIVLSVGAAARSDHATGIWGGQHAGIAF